MFQFPAFASYPYVFESKIPYNNAWKPRPFVKTDWIFQAFKVGCPIRRSMDQSLFAAPHGFSQRITSFFACACQGIHQMPLIHFFVLIVYAHHLLDLAEPFLLAYAQRGAKSGNPGKTQSAAKAIPSLTIKRGTTVTVTFYNRNTNDDIDVFDTILFEGTPVHFEVVSLRPASRDIIR
ncbi:hypothetical protein AGRO_2925 [Agrobacterium sp. ATCC 31749]|nr:hypothetical protein AGRO_2925 [Agrobacterium sp. ATCC 31749]WJK75509.1 hypothetical protein QOV31_002392 [Agrobacterium fabrum]WJK75848.1 hypothetical protein QOV31_002731 [Agrobacterium fabrum]WJK76771.1 hypothetical protein QOV31_003655 [Agrobacterium fabrum]